MISGSSAQRAIIKRCDRARHRRRRRWRHGPPLLLLQVRCSNTFFLRLLLRTDNRLALSSKLYRDNSTFPSREAGVPPPPSLFFFLHYTLSAEELRGSHWWAEQWDIFRGVFWYSKVEELSCFHHRDDHRVSSLLRGSVELKFEISPGIGDVDSKMYLGFAYTGGSSIKNLHPINGERGGGVSQRDSVWP